MIETISTSPVTSIVTSEFTAPWTIDLTTPCKTLRALISIDVCLSFFKPFRMFDNPDFVYHL